MEFSTFINQLLEKSRFWSMEPTNLNITFEPSRNHSKAGEVLIGIGNASSGEVHDGIVLNKHGEFRSVTEMVMAADTATLKCWQKQMKGPPAIHQFCCTLVIEDVSPDTCLAFIFWLARLYAVADEDFPQAWISHVSAWEQGDVHSTGRPESSWGCLHSILGHSYIDLKKTKENNNASLKVLAPQVKQGFYACLAYDLSLLAKPKLSPYSLPNELPFQGHQRAQLLLKQEQQAFEKTVAQGQLLQLRLPIQNSTGIERKVLVDAILATELEASGSLKSFLRTDRKYSWLKQGFSLMALYRPGAIGTGNDLIISTDPVSGTHLSSLWHKLERLEDKHWGKQRRRDKPRKINSYPDNKGPNQPWWDDSGKHTLLGSPKSIDDAVQRKVSWDEVCESIWQLYSPAHDLFLRSAKGGKADFPHRLPQHVPEHRHTMKRLLSVCWPDEDHSGFLLSPTMQRYLSACSMDDYSDHGVPLAELPQIGSFELLQLPGGFALVHANGATLVEDWSCESLHTNHYIQEFDRATCCCALLQESQQRIEAINPQDSQRALSENVKALSDIKLKLGKGVFDSQR